MTADLGLKSKIRRTAIAAVFGVLFDAGAAMASTMVDFTITDPIVGVETFVLPLDPIPSVVASAQFFEVDSVPVRLNGSPNTDSFEFLNSAVGGGFDDFGLGLYFLAPGGPFVTPYPQLYAGPEAAPQFLPGTYTIFNKDWGTTDTLVISSATPLPAALPLFASGLGALGLFGWRRKRKAQAVAA